MGSPAAAFGLWPSQGLKIMYSPPFTATCTPGYRVQTGEGACLINAVTGEVQSEES